MRFKTNRRIREKTTVEKMINIYCKKNHSTHNVRCHDCEELYQYSIGKIEKCIFGENKPVCSKCKINCYKPDMREAIKKVMRFSGPKMLFKHPILTLYHLIDSKKQ
ncbi:MAG: nitrous oxide-stimulated promoter family protein [Eubacteriales bacterium]